MLPLKLFLCPSLFLPSPGDRMLLWESVCGQHRDIIKDGRLPVNNRKPLRDIQITNKRHNFKLSLRNNDLK